MYSMRIYLTEDRSYEGLCFDVKISSDGGSVEYEVVYDHHNLYEPMLLEVLSGTPLSIDYVDPDTGMPHTDYMETRLELEQQLEEFRDFLVKWYHLEVDFRKEE